MAIVDDLLPAHPDAVRWALPAAAAAAGKGARVYWRPDGSAGFDIGMSLASWGTRVGVDLYPGPAGTTVRVTTKPVFGLGDWGIGKRVAQRLLADLRQRLNLPPAA